MNVCNCLSLSVKIGRFFVEDKLNASYKNMFVAIANNVTNIVKICILQTFKWSSCKAKVYLFEGLNNIYVMGN